MAAAHLFPIVRNHPFVDGNERVELMVLLAFLGLHSRRLDANAREVEDLVLGIAGGRVSKAEAYSSSNTSGPDPESSTRWVVARRPDQGRARGDGQRGRTAGRGRVGRAPTRPLALPASARPHPLLEIDARA